MNIDWRVGDLASVSGDCSCCGEGKTVMEQGGLMMTQCNGCVGWSADGCATKAKLLFRPADKSVQIKLNPVGELTEREVRNQEREEEREEATGFAGPWYTATTATTDTTTAGTATWRILGISR